MVSYSREARLGPQRLARLASDALTISPEKWYVRSRSQSLSQPLPRSEMGLGYLFPQPTPGWEDQEMGVRLSLAMDQVPTGMDPPNCLLKHNFTALSTGRLFVLHQRVPSVALPGHPPRTGTSFSPDHYLGNSATALRLTAINYIWGSPDYWQ